MEMKKEFWTYINKTYPDFMDIAPELVIANKGVLEEFFESKDLFLAQMFVEESYSSDSGLSNCRIYYFEDAKGNQISTEFESWVELFQHYFKLN